MALVNGTWIEPSEPAPSSDPGVMIGHPVGEAAGQHEEALAVAEAMVGLANASGGATEVDGTFIDSSGDGGS